MATLNDKLYLHYDTRTPERDYEREPTPVQDNPVPEHNQEHHRNGTKKKSWEKK